MDEKVLDKYIRGEASLEERLQVTEWLDADERNVHEMMSLHKLHDIAVMNQVTAGQEPEAMDSVTKKPMWKRIAIEAIKYAAVILLLLGIQQLVKKEHGDMQQLYVPSGQRAELILADGTKVWLNSRSRLFYPQTFGKERKVRLEGEAYFCVARNEHRDFVVQTSKVDIKVLGTEFNAKAYTEMPFQQVDLLKGKVELTGGVLGSKSISMKPDESIRLTGNQIERSRIGDYDYFKWTEGLLCFDHEPISSILKKLEIYYDIQIVVDKKDFPDEPYSGKFRTKDGVEQVLKVLQLEHDFVYVRDNNLNLITIK